MDYLDDPDYVGNYEAILYDSETEDETLYLDYSDDEEYLDDIDKELKDRGFDISRLGEETKRLLVTNTVQSWKDIATQPIKDVLYIIRSGLLHRRACNVIIQSSGSQSCLEGYGGSIVMEDIFKMVILSVRDLESLKSLYLTTVANMQILEDESVLSALERSWGESNIQLDSTPPSSVDTFGCFVKWIELNYVTHGGLKRGYTQCVQAVIKNGDLDSWKILIDNGYTISDDDLISVIRSPKVRELGEYYMKRLKDIRTNMVLIFGSVKDVKKQVSKYNIPSLIVCKYFLLRPDYDEEYSQYIVNLLVQQAGDEVTSTSVASNRKPPVSSIMQTMLDTYRNVHGQRTYPSWLLYFLEGVRHNTFSGIGHIKLRIIWNIENVIYV